MGLSNIYILIITIFFIILLYKYYIVLNGKIKIFSITFYFFISYVVYALVGSALLNCVIFEKEDSTGIYTDTDILFSVWAYTLLGLLCLFMGFRLAHILYERVIDIKTVKNDYVNTNLTRNSYDISIVNYYWILFLFALSIIVLVMYRRAIGGFPLESIFMGLKGAELAFLRSEATNNFSGRMYLYVMFMEVLPLFLFILLSFIKVDTNKRKWTILYLCLLIYNAFYALITLQKAPIINFILLCYIIYCFKKHEIKKKPLIYMGGLIVLLLILMYTFFMGVSDDVPASELLGGALHRIFISSIMPFYWYIKYTNEFGLLYGVSFPNPAGLLPFEHFRLTVEIMDYAKGAGDVVGSMPTVFIGEMYANFGLIGVCLSAILVGFVLQSIDIAFWKKMSDNKTVLNSALYIYLMIYCSRFTISGVSGIIVDTDLYFIAILTIWYIVRKRKFNLKLESSNEIYVN